MTHDLRLRKADDGRRAETAGGGLAMRALDLDAGIAAAKGDVIAFTDDDVSCAPDYLQAIRLVFSQYPVDAVQGRIRLDCEGGHGAEFKKLATGMGLVGKMTATVEGTLFLALMDNLAQRFFESHRGLRAAVRLLAQEAPSPSPRRMEHG